MQGVYLTINDCLYESSGMVATPGNGGISSGAGGALQFRESITKTVALDELSPGIPLPLEVVKTSTTTQPHSEK
jgi:hypothetical protein